MTTPINIALLAFDGMQILDLTGPASVFALANRACGQERYRVHILSAAGGQVQSNSAIAVGTDPIDALAPSAVHTLLIAGGNASGLRALTTSPAVRDWVLATAAAAQRYGSVCSGAWVLASLGLLDGKRATTHWETSEALARKYPLTDVQSKALYVQDGRIWTSAGVTTGIDMCLAMVEQDLNAAAAQYIARQLVLYARRPGFQSQFSPMLHAQERAGSQFAALVEWMKDNLTHVLDVPALAARLAMSERSFYRKFTEALGETPAYFVEGLRLDHGRQLIASAMSLKEVAAGSGFSTYAHFAKAFERRFGMTPGLFRELHR